jgi:hypothetical protein
MGLYLGRFDHEGRLLEPERPIHQPYAGRRLQPALALDRAGSGVTLWTADFMNVPVLYAHVYDEHGSWQASDQALTEIPQAMHDASERTRGVQLPSAAAREGGGFTVAWTLRGAVLCCDVKPDGLHPGEAQRINPREQQAEPGVQLCGSGAHGVVAVWPAAGHLWSLALRNAHGAPNDLGPGTLIRSVASDEGDGWLLVSGKQGSSVRRLRADGRTEGDPIDVCDASEQALDLAPFGAGVAVLVQTQGAKSGETPGRGRGGRTQITTGGARFQLRLVDPAQPKLGAPIEFLSEKAKLVGTPLVASDGTRLLVAWTDSREGDPDVYARLVAPGAAEPLLPEFRANTDRASADQINYRMDASGPYGIVTWTDKRDGLPRDYARRLAAPGSFAGDEFLLPGQGAKVAAGPATPALRPDGSSAILWDESDGALRLALFDAAGKPLGETRALETEGVKQCTLAALPADQGWLCAWIGSEPAVWAAHVDMHGAPIGEKRRLTREAKAALDNLELCFLGGRRLAALWDANDGGYKIRGRFLGLDGAPAGDEFELEGSPRHQDWDPSLAPAGNGGFVVSWTSGAPDDGSRDVVARFFDSDAHPAGPLLWISPTINEQDNSSVARLADGTWAVAWEDDISGYDHAYVRRIEKDRRELGPIVRINELETKSIQDRQAPRIAALADGLQCAFGDRSRSLGWDVRVRVVGPGFDQVGKR